MPVIKSAIKQLRKSIKNRQRNFRTRNKVHDGMKEFNDLIKAGKKEEAQKMQAAIYKTIDLAVKKNVLQKNTGNRRKSLVARKLNALK